MIRTLSWIESKEFKGWSRLSVENISIRLSRNRLSKFSSTMDAHSTRSCWSILCPHTDYPLLISYLHLTIKSNLSCLKIYTDIVSSSIYGHMIFWSRTEILLNPSHNMCSCDGLIRGWGQHITNFLRSTAVRIYSDYKSCHVHVNWNNPIIPYNYFLFVTYAILQHTTSHYIHHTTLHIV
jgi:hypothetical protein